MNEKTPEDEIHIVFDGPPSHESGRFVEVEDAQGHSIKFGEWKQVGDYFHLVFSPSAALRAERERAEKAERERDELRSKYDHSQDERASLPDCHLCRVAEGEYVLCRKCLIESALRAGKGQP